MSPQRHALQTERLLIRLADSDDAQELVEYDLRNADHLQRWEPARDPEVRFDAGARARSLANGAAAAEAGRAYLFLARSPDLGSGVIAVVHLSEVVRGVLQGCYLGYSVDAAYEGRGFASEAVGAVVRFAFRTLRLHRVMANYQPSNERSAALLRRLGFVPEGYARDYLFLDGAWRDHVLTSLVNPDAR
jgi:ribosomal-protein-alanine N-acetyltransferase